MSPMPSPPPIKEDPLRIEICRNAGDMARHAALLFVRQAGRALGAGGRFAVALSGGQTPRGTYALLPEEQYAYQIVWPAVHLFFSDERCVGPDDPASNYRMVRETLLHGIDIPAENVHRMRGEDDPQEAAAGYAEALDAFFGGAPRFDLVMLGVGGDGHTASLFPSSPALGATDRSVAAVAGPDGMRRLTLTLPVINAAKMVMVMASGEEKAEMVRRVLGKDAVDEGLPIQRVRPADGQLVWVLDADAASLLQMESREQEVP